MAFINLLEVIYPIGSVYMSTNNTSPASTIGGTWSTLTGGMLGLAGSTGVASAGENGGSRKISVNQIPSHTHGFQQYFWRASTSSFNQNQWLVAHTNNDGTTPNANSDFTTASTGGGRTISPLTRLSTLGDASLNLLGGEVEWRL